MYNPETDGQTATLFELNPSNWQPTAEIPGLAGGNTKAVLDPTGTYAFVLGASAPGSKAVSVVNLSKKAVVAYIHVPHGEPMDIALSPNGTQLFVSTVNEGGSDAVQAGSVSPDLKHPVFECKTAPGICIYSTLPFGEGGSVVGVNGYLAWC